MSMEHIFSKLSNHNRIKLQGIYSDMIEKWRGSPDLEINRINIGKDILGFWICFLTLEEGGEKLLPLQVDDDYKEIISVLDKNFGIQLNSSSEVDFFLTDLSRWIF